VPNVDHVTHPLFNQKMLVELMEESDLAIFRKEISIMDTYHHANIVRFVGANLSPPSICILTEFCGKGSLSKGAVFACIVESVTLMATLCSAQNRTPTVLDHQVARCGGDDCWHAVFACTKPSCG
jgi:serine/threonine protein kinase